MTNGTKYYFYGTLPNGSKGLVVAIDCVDMNEAYRILRMNANLDRFSPMKLFYGER